MVIAIQTLDLVTVNWGECEAFHHYLTLLKEHHFDRSS